MGRWFAVRSSPPLTLAAWFRHDSVRRLLGELDDIEAVLEVGAGEGAFGVRLASAYDYVGVEPDPAAYAKAQARLSRLGAGSLVRRLEELDDQRHFDIICAFEVLEHIADERAVLAAWRQRVRPGGWLLLSVPAGECRSGPADNHVGHYRRYEPGALRTLLAETGFAVHRIERVGLTLGYLLETMRPLIARASRPESSRHARSAASGRWLQPPDRLGWATRALTAPLRAVEARLPPHRPGTDLIVLARVQSTSTSS